MINHRRFQSRFNSPSGILGRDDTLDDGDKPILSSYS